MLRANWANNGRLVQRAALVACRLHFLQDPGSWFQRCINTDCSVGCAEMRLKEADSGEVSTDLFLQKPPNLLHPHQRTPYRRCLDIHPRLFAHNIANPMQATCRGTYPFLTKLYSKSNKKFNEASGLCFYTRGKKLGQTSSCALPFLRVHICEAAYGTK